ncbi:hypothetical protein MHYP_G00027450 [Metynnis hypsauchen]
MKVKKEEKDEKGKRKSAHHHEKHDHRHRKKLKSPPEETVEEKHSKLNGKYHRSSANCSGSGSLGKVLQESRITSSGKVKSDSANSASDADSMDVDTKEGFEKSLMSLDGNNNLAAMTLWHEESGNEGVKKETPEETSKHKMKSKHNNAGHSHKKKEKKRDKGDDLQTSREKNNRSSKSSTGDMRHKASAKVKRSETAIKEEDDELPVSDLISGCGQVKSDAKMTKGKPSPGKTAGKEPTVSTTKEKKRGQEKKRKSHSIEHDEAKKSKVKKEEDEDEDKDEGEKKAKKVEEEADKWKCCDRRACVFQSLRRYALAAEALLSPRWEERKHAENGQKWRSLEHKGPLFPPEYEPLPSNVSFLYNGTPVTLRPATEEVATFYAKMLDHEFTTKEVFQNNFFTDWKEVMTENERQLISDLSQCDFSNIHKYFLEKAEEKRNMTKEEKQVLKEEANKLTEEYGYCLLDGHREKIGNFRVEPPGLFRGRGEHPKMGKLKKRVQPEDVIINCSKDVKIPEAPAGHRWKKVQHDNTVTWLASWVENIHGHIKYIMLNPSSKLKGEKDWQKYETARKLKLRVDSIRSEYQSAWTSREMKQRQYGVALYFIDKLALRAGNEKDDDTADTVGCCSLRVEHINLHRHLDGLDYVVEFDFLGKDSIRYYNKVHVEKQVYKNLKLFMNSKNPDDDLFDRISTSYLNKKLNEAMPGLTAKVFRTFNASTTLQEQLNKLTTDDMTLPEKILAYNRANRAVAILCNHQRAAPKTFEKSMQLLQEKIKKKQEEVEKAKKELKQAKKEHKRSPSEASKKLVQKKEKTVKRLLEQLKKLQLLETDRNENKVIALGTSKLNYLDPRISVAWCKKNNVPVEKIYNKTQRAKFAWAIDMTDENFQF